MSEIKSFSDYTSKYNSNVDFSALFSGICRYTVFLIHR
jgi:hypothetical protein